MICLSCGGSSTIGGDGGSGSGRSCNVIEADYSNALNDALACEPAMSADACTLQVKTGLSPCPSCLTWVNPRANVAVSDLGTLEDEYEAAGCLDVGGDCPAIGCDNAPSAACTIDGQCSDMR